MSTEQSLVISQRTLPHVSFRGLQKVFKYLDLFTFIYAPLYNCSGVAFLNKYAPVLTFVEALIYQADDELEAGQRGDSAFAGLSPWLAHKTVILSLLQELQILDAKLAELIEKVSVYWDLENQLNYHGVITHEAILQAVALRACDFHVMHYLCLCLAQVPNRDAIFHAIAPISILMDLENDLVEYPEDVAGGDYNSYRMFVKLYGVTAPEQMAAQMAYYTELIQRNVAQLPAEDQAKFVAILSALRAKYGDPIIPAPILE